MGKKMKLPGFLFKSRSSSSEAHSWRQWPSCKHPKTLSFRIADDMFRTVNSVYFDSNDAVPAAAAAATADTPESWFTNSSESASFSTESEDYNRFFPVDGEFLETVVRGARSERRLFFDPGSDTSSSILQIKSNSGAVAGDIDDDRNGDDEWFPFKESVVLAMESDDPYGDFRRSMEEMVEIHGVKDWECLEELLGWYLRVNGKNNHGFIVGAFVDLLVHLAACSGAGDEESSTTTTSFSSAVSGLSVSSSPTTTTLCSSRGRINEVIDEEHTINERTVITS